MEITYLGDRSFRIRGKNATVVTGKFPDVSGKVIEGPGEYEIKGVSIIGIPGGDENTIYVYEMDGLRLADLGNLNRQLSDAQVEQIGDIDILMIPGAASVDIIQEIEPYFVITDKVLSEGGLPTDKLPKFQIKKEDIIPEQSPKIIVLEKK